MANPYDVALRERVGFHSRAPKWAKAWKYAAEQAETKLRALEPLAERDAPIVVAGDFNVSNHRALIADFAAQGFQTVQDREITALIAYLMRLGRNLEPAAGVAATGGK